jgi:hypothetical protein
MTTTEVTPVAVGDPVRVVDEQYGEHVGLVTCVHGNFSDWVPCINVVYVTGDQAKRDPYGQQVERLSSLQHLTQGPANMPRPGRYWINM